jgi:hypothetical protein
MTHLGALCDDFYVNMTLNTEMELATTRESLLHFFEQMHRRYPTMRTFYSRDREEFVLEEDKDRGSYRWCSVEVRRIASGCVNPESVEAAMQQHRAVLELVPYELTVTPLDCEALDLLFGFDFTYRGNHNELVAEALGLPPAYEGLLNLPGARIINYEPTLTFALDSDCRLQCRVAIETRTNAYNIRTEDYPEEQLSVYVTARHYGSLPHGRTFVDVLERLEKVCRDVLEAHVIDQVLRPLARTIACK